jgi:hypothetical protein
MLMRPAIHPLKIMAAVGTAFVLWGFVPAYASSPAGAADTVADDGACTTLREAIEAASTDNTASGACGGTHKAEVRAALLTAQARREA